MRKWLGVVAVVATGATVMVANGPASAVPDDRLVTGTITVDWGPSDPLTQPLPGRAHVRVKACVLGTGPTCFPQADGWVDATTGAPGDANYFREFNYSFPVDSAVAYVVGVSAAFDMGDPSAAQPASRQRSVLQPALETVQFVTPGAEDVSLNWPFPDAQNNVNSIDASYYRISGNIAYAGTNPFHGVGACPSGSPLVGNACEGIAFTWARADGTFMLNLPRNAWRAAGFAIPAGTGSSTPALGIVNLLDFRDPPTAATWQRSLDFSADLINVNGAVEDGAPNSGDGNYDGVDDSLQTEVASMQSVTDSTYVTIDAGDFDVTSGAAQPLVALLAAPPPAEFPNGITSFTVGPVASGATIPVDITFHDPLRDGSLFLKYTETGTGQEWTQFPFTDVTADPTLVPGRPYTIRIMLTDGGPGDYDGQVNGYITDPFAQVDPTAYEVSKLAVSTNGANASVEFSVGFLGTPLERLPGGATLTYKCGGSIRTPLEITGTDGVFQSEFVISGNKTCNVQLLIPMSNGVPTIERQTPVRSR